MHTILCSNNGMSFEDNPNINNILLGKLDECTIRGILDIWAENSFILFEGGEDVDPSLYGEKNFYSGCDINRDRRELWLLNQAIERNIPFMGICRGHQFLNVAHGGTLYQDLHKQYKGRHSSTHAVALTEYAKTINFDKLMRTYPGAENFAKLFGVNSLHHQGVKDVNPYAVVLANHADGLVEGLAYERGISVQWHPEFLNHYDFVDYMFDNYVGKR